MMLCYVSWPLKALKALCRCASRKLAPEQHNNEVYCVCVCVTAVPKCIFLWPICSPVFTPGFPHLRGGVFSYVRLLRIGVCWSFIYRSFGVNWKIFCVYPYLPLRAHVSWSEMSAFNGHTMWFLFCCAQKEAGSVNLSLLRRWSEI